MGTVLEGVNRKFCAKKRLNQHLDAELEPFCYLRKIFDCPEEGSRGTERNYGYSMQHNRFCFFYFFVLFICLPLNYVPFNTKYLVLDTNSPSPLKRLFKSDILLLC